MRISKDLCVVDFDIECRPLSWYGGDWVTKEPTAIACSIIGDKAIHSFVLQNGDLAERELMAEWWLGWYERADMVTGHYIRGFDLPVLNGALFELGYPSLGDKLAQDTKLDLLKFSGLSKSQENLGATLGLKAPKVSMDQDLWRRANRLEPDGVEATRKRVEGDVRQHKEMRAALLERGMLAPPKVWKSTPSASAKYTP